MTVLFDDSMSMLKITDKPDINIPTNVINKVHLIRSKVVSVDYLH